MAAQAEVLEQRRAEKLERLEQQAARGRKRLANGTPLLPPCGVVEDQLGRSGKEFCQDRGTNPNAKPSRTLFVFTIGGAQAWAVSCADPDRPAGIASQRCGCSCRARLCLVTRQPYEAAAAASMLAIGKPVVCVSFQGPLDPENALLAF
jgi:hypothetical protein